MKKTPNKIDTTDLQEYFRTWKINIPLIAKAIGMPESTFKNKLRPSLPQYNFSKEEYTAILVQMAYLSDSIKIAIKKEMKQLVKYSNSQKVTNYPEN